MSREIKRDIKKALSNENLRGALGRFGDAYPASRAAAYAKAAAPILPGRWVPPR